VPAGVPVDPPPELLLEVEDPPLLELDDPLELVELPLLLETEGALEPLLPPQPGIASAPINSHIGRPL
jgi:hypothetical protein